MRAYDFNEIADFIENYTEDYKYGMDQISTFDLGDAIEAIKETICRSGTIFVCGNGGSSSISDHFVCDTLKGIREGSGFCPKVVSLVSNGPLLTAIANDFSYERVFSYQIESFLDINSKNDILIIVSSSGNSPNVINALLTARVGELKTIAMVGFDGGRVKKENLADIILHIPVNNYGVVEDCHQSLMHIISQWLAR